MKLVKPAHFFFLAVLFSTLFSCASRKDMAYLYEGENKGKESKDSNSKDTNSKEKESKATAYEPFIQKDDLLHITVSAENPEVAAPYNLKAVSVDGATGSATTGQNHLEAYLVDKNGEIDFPQLGKIKLAGLTRLEAVEKIKTALTDYIVNPTVYIRLVNFKVSVLGEVTRPGVHSVAGERMTLLEALSLSGDLTVYGKRKNIMVIREKEGVKTIGKVDITNPDFINSPYYYLSQNDVVYVEPNKVKMNASTVGPNIAVGLSVVSMAIGIVLLLITK
ncbi:polysaccharide biosynthesis/export family protein [Flavobacterium pedocola]